MELLIGEFYIRLIAALATALLFVAFKRLFRQSIFKIFNRLGDTATDLISSLNQALKQPVEYIWIVTGIYIALYISPFTKIVDTEKAPLVISEQIALSLDFIPIVLLTSIYSVIIVALITWATYNLVPIYENTLTQLGNTFSILNNTLLVRFSAKIIRFIILLIGSFSAISIFGDLKVFITSIGVGGVVITLIAQDVLKDILNGVILMIDKPFVIGDWVQIGDLEGLVEDVSFRSTRVRTFTQSVVVMPNSSLSGEHIINWSAMPKRRVLFNLGLTYSTSKDEIEFAIKEIKDILNNHPDVDSDSYIVHFDSFGDFSLDISIYYFSFKTTYKDYTRVKGEVNLQILEMANANGLDIAFPTQTVFVEKDKESKLQESIQQLDAPKNNDV